MESAVRNPYSSTRPVFDLIPGGRKDIYDKESDEILETLQAIEKHTAETYRMVDVLVQGGAEESVSSSAKSVWRLFWSCQIIGFSSLIGAELGRLGLDATKNLRFLGLGLIFVALECVLVAKFLDYRGVSYGRKETPDTDS